MHASLSCSAGRSGTVFGGASLGSSGAKKKPTPSSTVVEKGDPKAARKSVGDALRSAYQDTINEKVPDELLDLLGKLG